jgi:archaellum component FlaC
MTVDEDERKGDAIMTSVEEMLEGFDWTAPAAAGADGIQKRGADAIEARLMDELAALDSANIHAFLESDDRIAQVLGHIDEALLELDEIDAQITGYRMQLNAVTDDISFIESQNRGLQVQTSNQKALLDELQQLLQIAEVPPEDLRVLVHESPSSAKGVQVLERAAASLYKALQAGMDSGTSHVCLQLSLEFADHTANAEVQASIHRLREYQDASAQFCKRLIDYLEITFQHQSDQALSNFKKAKRTSQSGGMLQPHTSMGEYLMMYEGLVLYIKEMDEVRYQRLCSVRTRRYRFTFTS